MGAKGAIELVSPGEAGLSAERLKRIPQYFDTYIQKKKLPCCACLVARGGQVAHLSFQGATEMGGSKPIDEETIYRIYSMTKPITSVAAMMLFEEGAIRLDHELHRYIPEFQDVMVFDGGAPDAPKLRKPDRPILVRDLFLHTSGLTYAFLQQGPVDSLYRAKGIDYSRHPGDLKSFCEPSPPRPWCSRPATSGITRTPPMCSAASSRWLQA